MVVTIPDSNIKEIREFVINGYQIVLTLWYINKPYTDIVVFCTDLNYTSSWTLNVAVLSDRNVVVCNGIT